MHLLHDAGGDEETPLERPQGGILNAEPGFTPGEAES